MPTLAPTKPVFSVGSSFTNGASPVATPKKVPWPRLGQEPPPPEGVIPQDQSVPILNQRGAGPVPIHRGVRKRKCCKHVGGSQFVDAAVAGRQRHRCLARMQATTSLLRHIAVRDLHPIPGLA